MDINRDDGYYDIKWLDDHYLLIIMGFKAGTIARGGDVYYYHIPSGANGKVISRKPFDVQIESIKMHEGYVEFGLCNLYDNCMRHLWYSENIPLSEIYNLIECNKIVKIGDELIYSVFE